MHDLCQGEYTIINGFLFYFLQFLTSRGFIGQVPLHSRANSGYL